MVTVLPRAHLWRYIERPSAWEERHGRQTAIEKTLKIFGRREKGDGLILESWKHRDGEEGGEGLYEGKLRG